MTQPGAAGPTADVVIAGLGSEYRHDDGVGLVVSTRAAELDQARDVGPLVDPLDLLGRWDGARLAIVVDAVRSGASPGSIRVMDLTTRPSDPARGVPLESVSGGHQPVRAPSRARSTSSHGIGLVGVLRLGRAVGQAPLRVVVIGIEGDDFSQGVGLSPAVEAAVPPAVREVARLVEELAPCA